MRTAISKHTRDFVALILLFVVALGVGGYILSNQRLYLPNGCRSSARTSSRTRSSFSTAQSVTPGQGQTVNIAGVKVGEITEVDLAERARAS